MIAQLFNTNRTNKRLITMTIDSIFVVFAFWCAMFLRLETLQVLYEPSYWMVAATLVPADRKSVV